MAEKNQRKYYGFAIGIMLATKSALRADFAALDAQERTADKLTALIRHNLYNTVCRVQNGKVVPVEPSTPNPALEEAIQRLDTAKLLSNWAALEQATKVVEGAINLLLDYDPGGSCPTYLEQPEMTNEMGAVGKRLPDKDYSRTATAGQPT